MIFNFFIKIDRETPKNNQVYVRLIQLVGKTFFGKGISKEQVKNIVGRNERKRVNWCRQEMGKNKTDRLRVEVQFIIK